MTTLTDERVRTVLDLLYAAERNDEKVFAAAQNGYHSVEVPLNDGLKLSVRD